MLINVEISQNVLTPHIQIKLFLVLSRQRELTNSASPSGFTSSMFHRVCPGGICSGRSGAGFPSTVKSQKPGGGEGCETVAEAETLRVLELCPIKDL